ncbi:GrpB family protein [Microbacterium sp. BLY]|uniref:GrpB family protein n=1 Tax=Microbacterium sp. BLY TaxID=2823280 RepID=UPI001B31B8CF|nr:GrpB family protein [Microbacterium sp. BLY]MBP3976877.1 GrpB family protein [Microbacterium sp. BLY]
MLLVPSDPSWPQRFEEFAASIRAAGADGWVVEHIGSTAIPGMSTKPIIDLAVRMNTPGEYEASRSELEAVGWRAGSGVRTHPVMIMAPAGERLAIAHFFTAGDWDLVPQRLLRDWLRTHPDDAERYERVKREAARAASERQISYNAAKTAVIQEIVDKAREARGLEPVDVDDKRRAGPFMR